MNKDRLLKNLEILSLAFGPSGCETPVTDEILRLADGHYDSFERDSFGNLIFKIASDSYAEPLMLSAHTDEVGFIITDIDEYGYLHFANIGGINNAVIAGRRVSVECTDGHFIYGVICAKPVHLQTAEEKERPTPPDELCIDIGATCRKEAVMLVNKGCYATFDSEYTVLGEDQVKCKALDNRFGCAIGLEAMMSIWESGKRPPRDTYFAFTTREEIGYSGALVAANRIRPEYAIILETTAINDMPEVPAHLMNARLGEGVCVGTVFDKELFDLACGIAEENGLKWQMRKYIAAGNDAVPIHKSTRGVKALAIVAATRYLHSPSNVESVKDICESCELLKLMIERL